MVQVKRAVVCFERQERQAMHAYDAGRRYRRARDGMGVPRDVRESGDGRGQGRRPDFDL